MTPGNQGIQALDVNVHGVGVNHGQVNQYVIGEDATAEERLEQGVRSLRAGMRDRAEQLISEAVERSDTHSPEGLYYWALSIVSRRSPEDLTDEDWHKLRHALDLLRGDPGEYGAAGRALHELMKASVGPSRTGEPGSRLDATLLLESLPDDEIRAQLKDHLRYLLRGIERDSLDSEEAGELGERLAKNRKERAPLFFTPDPVLQCPLPPEEPKFDPAIAGILGGIGAVLGVLLLIMQIPDDLLESEKAVAWLAFTTGCLALAFGVPEWLRSAVRSARRGEWRADPDGKVVFDQEQNPFRRQGARLGAVLINNKQWREEREQRAKERRKTKKARFRRTVEAIVQDRFLDYEPKGSENAKQWRRHTERARQDLIDDLTHRHWRTGAPGALDWLIQLRAKEIGGWHVDPAHVRFEEGFRRVRGVCALLGVGLLAVTVVRIIPGRDPDDGVIAASLLAGSVGAISLSALHYARVRAYRRDRKQYEDDLLEREKWQNELTLGRPGDEQMARWYDLDQRYLRREVLAEHRMEHRDILFSFFLVEGVPGCVRAKVKNGPPRYSQYRQTFYVLTSSGVWVSAWNVDFATGEHDGRQDTVFRYDAISSVTVESVGVRSGDSLREIVALSEDGALRDAGEEDGLVLHEALRLALHNGQRLTALLENYEQLYDSDHEDRGQLRRLALESSGITAGFRILTALATEGRKWFAQRRQRSYQAFVGSGPLDGDHPVAEPPVLLLSE
ncbi:hypothetical protein AB0I27_12055 [Streptomyces sp. NPDC050597]|uniref:hypothetical protein n=1 Tax=Streptomyces sp. NPDC050597 TaxID=3157212 RepID=UPI0034448AE4